MSAVANHVKEVPVKEKRELKNRRWSEEFFDAGDQTGSACGSQTEETVFPHNKIQWALSTNLPSENGVVCRINCPKTRRLERDTSHPECSLTAALLVGQIVAPSVVWSALA